MSSSEKGRSARCSIPAAQPPAVDLPFPALRLDAPSQGREALAGRWGDGCGCPAWVLRCAHWGDVILTLADYSISQSLHVCGTNFKDHEGAYGVANRHVGEFEWARCGCPLLTGCSFVIDFPDLPAAEAEFFKREAQMLERDE